MKINQGGRRYVCRMVGYMFLIGVSTLN